MKKVSNLVRVLCFALAGLLAFSALAGIVISGLGGSVNAQEPNTDFIQADIYNPTQKSQLKNPELWNESTESVDQGGRSENTLVIYDKNYGKSKTGTNAFGVEVIINNSGEVTAIDTGNCVIPQMGYVVSAHGTKADWLTANAKKGVRIFVDTATLTITLAPKDIAEVEKIYSQIQQHYNDIFAQYNEATQNLYEYDSTKVNEILAQAKEIMDNCATLVSMDKAADLVKSKSTMAALFPQLKIHLSQSRPTEARALWVRPIQKNDAEVAAYVKKIADSNINTIFLETWYDGYTIYPTKSTTTCQNPAFAGFDVLSSYVKECKNQDIEIHSWVENFFAGIEWVENGGVVLAKHPQWALVSKTGLNYEETMYGKFYFLNPADPQCREFVLSLYDEILANYEVDGLQLDYVRYPERLDDKTDFGYDEITINGFKEKHNIDPKTILSGSEDEKKWDQYREDLINSFVYEVYDKAKSIRKNIVVSACVTGKYASAPAAYKQNATQWIKEGKIDMIVPMNYDITTFSDDVSATVKLLGDNQNVTALIGISAQSGYTTEQMLELVTKASTLKIAGTSIFESSYFFSAGYDKALLNANYRNKAISPIADNDRAIKSHIDYVMSKLENVYKPLISPGDYEKIKSDFSKAINLFYDKKYDEAYIELSNLLYVIDESEFNTQKLETRLVEHVNYIKQIAKKYFNPNIVIPLYETSAIVQKDQKLCGIIVICVISGVILIAGATTATILIKRKKLKASSNNNSEDEK